MLILLAAVPLIAVLAIWLTLQLPAGRQAILGYVSDTLETATGVRLRAADFALRLSPGRLELEDLAISTGDAPPFMTAPKAWAGFRWRGLFAKPLLLEEIALERPAFDLRQPLPPSSGGAASEEPPGIEIRQIRLEGGGLRGESPNSGGESETQEAWLREWSLEEVDLEGSLLAGKLDLRLAPARLTLVRSNEAPLELEVTSRLAGPLAGPLRIDGLKASAEGLALGASGELGLSDDQPLSLRLDLDADPALLLTQVAAGSRVRARGELDLRRFQGQLDIVAEGFPSAALEPWVGAAARPGGETATIDLEAHLRSDPDAPQEVTGQAELRFRQAETTIAEASVNLVDGRLDENGVALASLTGDVHVEARDLPAEFLRPFLGSELLDQLAADGTSLDLEGDLRIDAAQPAQPQGKLDVFWRRGGERLMSAAGRFLRDPREVALAFEATLLEREPGRRQITGRLIAPAWPELAAGRLRDTRIEVALDDIAAALDDVAGRWPRLLAPAVLESSGFLGGLAGPVELTAALEGRPGVPASLDFDVRGRWRPEPGSQVEGQASGPLLAKRGEASLRLESFDLARLSDEAGGRMSGTIEASGSAPSWTARLALDGTDLRYGEGTAFEELRLEASTDGETVTVSKLAGRMGEARFSGDGDLGLAAPLLEAAEEGVEIRGAHLRLAAERPFAGIEQMDLEAELGAGIVRITRLEIEAPTGPGDLKAHIPLGSLAAFGVAVDRWPVAAADGRIEVDLGFPSLDFGALLREAGQDPPWTQNVASLTGRVWIDPADLTAAEGELLMESWSLEVGRHRLEVGDDPVLMAMDDYKLEILPVTLLADGYPMNLEGALDLRPGWRIEDGFDTLLRHLDGSLEGIFDAGLLTPYLVGGVGQGPLALEAEISGPPSELKAKALLDGPEATVLYASPYVTQLSAPKIRLELREGEVSIDGAGGRLNGGDLALDARRTAAGDWTFNTQVEGARYRLAYGLTTVLNADLSFALPAEGAGALRGNVEVVRGVQRQDIDLDREILDVLFAAPDLTGAGGDGLEDLELDIDITTAQGVKLKNNIVDLHAGWSTLEIRGTLGEPAIEGRIEIDPGGRIHAYGQTARIDQGALIFTGEPGLPPELDVQPTWDFEDQTVSSAGDELQELRMTWRPSSPEAERERQEAERSLDDNLVGGLASLVGGRLSDRLGGARVSVRPVLVFGEVDPSTKLVISRDLSNWIAFAVAVDLRNSQNQTYVLDLHRLERLPRVVFQLFTEDGETDGITVQQSIPLGRWRKTDRRLGVRRIHFDSVPEGVSEKALRRALKIDREDPFSETVDFETEVDLAEFLRRRGYPGARVETEIVPVEGKRGARQADLEITIDPGPRVSFELEGTPIPSRRTVLEPYRVDFYEERSLEEVRELAVRALRSQGYLEPRVETEVAYRQGARTVTIRAEGGRKVKLDRLVFNGLDRESSEELRRRFETLVARIELAVGRPKADEWLRKNLRSLGYPEAELRSRELREDGRELTLDIDPGPRQEIVAVRIAGLTSVEVDDLRRRLPLRPGDVPRSDLIVAGNFLIKNDLRSRGYSEARVRTRLEPVPESDDRFELIYEVEPGTQYRLDSVRFAGLRATREPWARKLSELRQDAVLDPALLGQARRRLAGTRLFESVRTRVERGDDGLARLTFEVEERPRYQLAYGLRYESASDLVGDGSSVVLDLVNRNFLGRGITLGARGLYGDRDRAGRLYLSRAGLFGRRLAFEIYVEERREETSPTQDLFDDSLLIDTTEFSAQLSFPLGRLTSRAYARFRDEFIREKVPSFFPFEEEIRFPFLGWQLLYDRRDDRLDPTRGFFVSTDLSASGGFLSSDFDFVRLFAHLQWMQPVFRFGERQIVWAQSYRLGLLSGDRLPPDELFKAGGERSVRGYGFESLLGGELGGEALLVVNQELRVPVWGDLDGVAFFDIGNAWATRDDFGTDFFKSLGLGLRASTPIGLLRLDVAYPLDRRAGDSDYRTYLGFGHSF